MKGLKKLGNDAIVFQTEFQKELNEYASLKDVLLVIFCLVVPFFTENYFINSVIFGFFALFYLRITIDFRKKRNIYYESPQTYREIIEQHREILRNYNIRQTRKNSEVNTTTK